jgi:hypothetical protein
MGMKQLAATLIALLVASNVCAEGYLFPTDIVDKGRFDLQGSVSKETYDQTWHLNFGGLNANVEERRDRISQAIRARYGVAEDWHIELHLPYDSRARVDTSNRPGGNANVIEGSRNFDGAGNIELGIKHRFIGSAQSPFDLSGRLLVGANTAGDSKTTLMAEAIAGWRPNDSLKMFAGYQGQFSDQDVQPDRHSLLMGLYQRVNERLTIVPQASISYYEPAHLGSLTTSGHIKQYSLGIAAYLQIYRNTYLIPGFAFGQISSYSYGPFAHYDETSDPKAYSLSLYHLF